MKTNINIDHSDILQDPSFRLTAERLALQAGVRADLKGFEGIVEGIILYGTDSCTTLGEIYEVVGSRRGIQSKSAMRDISYAVAHAYDIHIRLSRMIGINIPKNEIHAGLVIAILGKLFKNPDLSVYA